MTSWKRDGRQFTPEQISYLGTLPAVASVGPYRILYARGFQRACIRRYLDGAHPTDLFRKAGLDPAIVGAKRIERCFAKWRSKADELMAEAPGDDSRYFIQGEPDADPVYAEAYDGRVDNVRTRARGEARSLASHVEPVDPPGGGYEDIRAGVLLNQLTGYIGHLERENRELKRRLATLSAPAGTGGGSGADTDDDLMESMTVKDMTGETER